MARKTWVIPTSAAPTPRNGSSETSRLASDPRLGGIPLRHVRTAPSAGSASPAAPTRVAHPGRTLALSYFLGPLGLAASSGGRSRPIWLVIGALVVVTGALVAEKGWETEAALRRGSGYGALWLGLGVVAALGSALVWARSVTLGGREVRPAANRVPRLWGIPWVAGVLGAIFPGLGLHFTRSSGRAAGAILGLGALVTGVWVLHHAEVLWIWNEKSRYGGVSESMLELLFVVAGLMVAVGALSWVIQALDGIRQAEDQGSREPRANGDAFAMVFMVASVMFLALLRPAIWAAELDARAESTHALGLRFIPLVLAEAASRLDPARPDYALQAAALLEDIGQRNRAESIRAALDARWPVYDASRHSSVGWAGVGWGSAGIGLRDTIEAAGALPGCPGPPLP